MLNPEKVKGMASNNRPATAGGITGALTALLIALSEWGLNALRIPEDVETALTSLLVLIAAAVGTVIGKVAQRYTWAENTHKAAVAYALQLDPQQWSEALAALGISREEALDLIGVNPDEVP